jgi:lipopolysaccharide export system protein LptA
MVVSVICLYGMIPIFLVPASAENKSSGQASADTSQPIEITADRLVSNADEKYAEFIGKVKATQGSSQMTADNLRIYYEGNLVNPKEESSDQEMIKKIVAKGNVDIITDQYVAKADQVDYDVVTKILVLSGKDANVKSGQNSITGSKITFYQADGRIKVEGSTDQRVNAVFYSKGKTPDLFGSETVKGENDN